MDLLSVKGNQIVDAQGREVRLRGTAGQTAAEEMLCTGDPTTRAMPNGVSGRWWADA